MLYLGLCPLATTLTTVTRRLATQDGLTIFKPIHSLDGFILARLVRTPLVPRIPRRGSCFAPPSQRTRRILVT